jgi:zinc transport system substrate-binding protein
MTRLLFAAIALAAAPASAAPIVATDIPPVQSIVARVMQGVGTPRAIVPPGASLHGYALRPSAAGLLAEADAVIWIGPDLTPWLDGPISALAGGAQVLELSDVDGLSGLPLREGGPFEAHDHDHDHDDHDGEPLDAHIWLDPRNGTAMAVAVADLLTAIDPENAATYAANAAGFAVEMAALETELAATLAPVSGRPYAVFHDAYQHFENRFAMPAAGSVSLGDADQPSAARVAAISDRIRDTGAVCVFAEPQFEPRLIATVTEGTDARSGILDPEGATLELGPDLYPTLLRGIAEGLATCLGD